MYKFLQTNINICVCLIIVLNVFNNISSTQALPTTPIKSSWTLIDPNEQIPYVSAEELRLLPAKLQKLRDEQAEEQRLLDLRIKAIQDNRKNLIECLNENGVKLYTSEKLECEACKKQDKYLGDDITLLTGYVNCDTAKFECPLRGVTGYPTWYLGPKIGMKTKGVKTLEDLARITHCPFIVE